MWREEVQAHGFQPHRSWGDVAKTQPEALLLPLLPGPGAPSPGCRAKSAGGQMSSAGGGSPPLGCDKNLYELL